MIHSRKRLVTDVFVRGGGSLCCWNRDGTLAWRQEFKNGVTLAGLDYLAACGFTAGSQISSWYVGLVDSAGFTALSSTDTLASKSWSENTGYSGNRPQWVNTENGQMAASNGPFTFPITVNGTINGLFIASTNVKGGTTGTLWAHALLPTPSAITVGQSLTGTYSTAFSGG